ncbi:hypothetical protein [Micromonospora humi]|uniref:hypothetical protein n=1 Tax=Micromonospora humi TaxID=745366 RepID=UPI0015864D05|nr:hypothetical protein [Micromonospora humi]
MIAVIALSVVTLEPGQNGFRRWQNRARAHLTTGTSTTVAATTPIHSGGNGAGVVA